MPCHNHQTLPEVIVKTQSLNAQNIAGESRIRILKELKELRTAQASGSPLSFMREEDLKNQFLAMPGEFYNLLEKGNMPPSWAPELMKQIKWPYYKPLTPKNRVLLLQYAKPYSEKYLR
ncbi:hypothetical protein COW36_24575 [bacterium (Candidatus Blackallbacteria) CG17_big_fil_post_rev_8_21_14_2_50_48_46]|uniref:Uncharacterized protein n=1 Tax=bacterium (Candidatus Blackallbacteria) CG17_big_fil_post_rev_8_21_14_2_50_48_46 TaxID=2014261 RepID=A0A2M7FXH5_9BACT|nr:MAG: hypothetical protein COW64_19515 [bacterium (Candidatus Blackallbacteria) CG18_big_fil_WC_8_21_14_2_50_49_26]PIW13845.1 MAG: hypothetical protein COW36_24575 [bacterium (Candidatus Blackallbacteria) CG17_big_fil_post_rev_8_21_14_2_50_48_46]PIW45071.1 MAG: hypothetical protein COW20_22205 [bacterium (Candidatus Blackallbacteria) CG13_big_fil_rev_8_21_14_2_50_49_14]